MLQFAVSLIFGFTVGMIMCLVLWLNTRFTFKEFFMIICFVMLSSIVWNFTSGRFSDITLLALMVVWTLLRILFDRRNSLEKMLSFTMSTIIMLNYYIYITFIGLRVDGTSKVTLIYMGVYLLLIAAIFFILWILENHVKTFFITFFRLTFC